MEREEVIIRLWDLFESEFLEFRVEGEVVREKMEEIIMRQGKVAVLDFEGVRGISHTFADEIVGIFTQAFGEEWIKRNVKVINANENVRRMLNFAFNIRRKRYNPNPPDLQP